MLAYCFFSLAFILFSFSPVNNVGLGYEYPEYFADVPSEVLNINLSFYCQSLAVFPYGIFCTKPLLLLFSNP